MVFGVRAMVQTLEEIHIWRPNVLHTKGAHSVVVQNQLSKGMFPKPTEIDNNHLLEEDPPNSQNFVVKKGCGETYDYELVSEPVWKALSKW